MSQVITTETEVFTFKELTTKAQEKAIELRSQQNGEFWDGEFTLENWKIKLEELGFNNPTISYSGFYSQGDGASFTSDYVDIQKVIKSAGLYKQFRSFYMKLKAWGHIGNVYRSGHHYYHEKTVSFQIVDFYEEHKDEEAVCDALTEYVETLSRKIYKDLKEEYEYETGEVNIRDYLESDDDQLYTANGECFIS